MITVDNSRYRKLLDGKPYFGVTSDNAIYRQLRRYGASNVEARSQR